MFLWVGVLARVKGALYIFLLGVLQGGSHPVTSTPGLEDGIQAQLYVRKGAVVINMLTPADPQAKESC